jgi:glycosyltransferase involved in cell wall biosynthesis
MNISILILTKNEEKDLPDCLASVAWSNDIHVLDSESTDQTRTIATAFGATVTIRKFDDYSQQRNFGLHNIAYKNAWLLILDADERIPLLTAQAMQSAIASAADPVVAFRFRRKDYFMGTWLKHAQASPFFIRLVRPQRVCYSSRIVNEVLEVRDYGQIVDLDQSFDHYPFSKGIDYWLSKHNLYSRMEAQQIMADQNQRFSIWKSLFERDFNRRRWHQKGIFYRLPCRPLLKFILLYFLKGGFLDGRAGLYYCQMQACYERMIVLKTGLLQHERQNTQNT